MKKSRVIISTILILLILSIAGGFICFLLAREKEETWEKKSGAFKGIDEACIGLVNETKLMIETGLPELLLKENEDKIDAFALEARDAMIKAREEANKTEWEDIAAPVFLYYRSNPVIKVGDSFDIHKYIGYADDVDRDVDLTVNGRVNTSSEGTYSLTITLTDDTGKTTVRDMDVSVVTSIPSSPDTTEREQFTDFVTGYKTDSTMVGIDVSRWQEDIDFERVKNAGCEFVYMRLGGFDSGEFFVDRYYEKNIAGAKAAGLKIGIYWYGEESNEDEVAASVKFLMDELHGESLDFPIAYDWEDYRNFETHGMNLHDLNKRYADFEKEIEKYGYKTCLYGSKNALNNTWTDKRKNPAWLAHYNSSTNYEGEYFMWQHSCVGRIDGISGDVDLDVFYPDRMILR